MDGLKDLLKRHLSRNKRRAQTAIALPAAKYLWKTCDAFRPSAILDMGSGFSTVVFRSWALNAWDSALHQDAGACCPRVISTDHMPAWLEVTRQEVAAEGLDGCRGELVMHSEFQRRQQEAAIKFGLIFVDLGPSALRVSVLAETIGWLAPGGVMILDDWHFAHYRPHAEEILHDAGMVAVVQDDTRDQFGRYMAIAVKE